MLPDKVKYGGTTIKIELVIKIFQLNFPVKIFF